MLVWSFCSNNTWKTMGFLWHFYGISLCWKCRNPAKHRLCEQLWLRSCSNCWRIRDYFGGIPFIFRYPSSILSGEHPKPSVSIGIPSHSKPCFFILGSTDKPSTNCYSCSPFFANIFLLLTFFQPTGPRKVQGRTLTYSSCEFRRQIFSLDPVGILQETENTNILGSKIHGYIYI